MLSSLAAVFQAPGLPLVLKPFPLPRLVGGEALVRIRCATICGSDLHTCFGRRHSPAPSILGHEMVGEIFAAGPDGVQDYRGEVLAPGERVTWSMVWSCGECYWCRHALRPKCERLFKFGHSDLSTGPSPLTGAMSQYCFLPGGTAIFRVPAGLPDTVAAPANCATATVSAVLRTAGSVEGSTVVVLGAGMLGQTACAMAVSRGAASVIAIEPDRFRRESALRFGAKVAIDSSLPVAEITSRVRDLSNGRGADAVLEFAGTPEAVELGLELLRMGGRLVLAGAVFPGRPVPVAAEQIVRRMIRIEGVHNYSPEDLDAALAFLSASADRYPFEELVGASFALREVNAAIAYAETRVTPRVALLPWS